MGQVEKPFRIEAEEIETQSFVLKDRNGKKRVELGSDLYNNYGLRLYSADGRYLAGLVERTDTKAVQLELNDSISASSASLVVGNGVASLDLTGDQQTKEEWDRKSREYGKQFNAAKTPPTAVETGYNLTWPSRSRE
jgi:hypothetical protein